MIAKRMKHFSAVDIYLLVAMFTLLCFVSFVPAVATVHVQNL